MPGEPASALLSLKVSSRSTAALFPRRTDRKEARLWRSSCHRQPNPVNEAIAVAAGPVDIAVLDDDIDFRNYIEDLLRDEGGYTVRTFAQPDELFAAAEARLPD